MLQNLHVEQLALIEREDIEFSDGLNILTGETGAGKSIILGALSMALGAKTDKSVLRKEGQDAYVEAIFHIDDENIASRLGEMDIDVYDDEVILSRRLSALRSVAKINGESVPVKKLKEAGELLIDIYGQQEHVSLLKKSQHLAMLDEFAKKELGEKKALLSEAYHSYRKLEDEYNGASMDDSAREKELLFLRHEAEEIENANIQPGEDEALEEEYRTLSNSQKILEAISMAVSAIDEGASDAVGRSIRELSSVSEYDERLGSIESVFTDIESLMSDARRSLCDYRDGLGADPGRFAEVEERVNTINRIKDKYGSTLEKVFAALDERKQRIEELENYDLYLDELKKKRQQATERLDDISNEVSGIRKNVAKQLCARVQEELSDLNFLEVDFSMEFSRLPSYSAGGIDDAQFVISMNPGAAPAPLKDIASGGELSRIMLAIKTVLAGTDEVDTLVFDEIDAGISGRTAQAVAKKLKKVSRERQVICITHLPQIAAQADRHFGIEKHLESDAAISAIHPLSEEDSVMELARMLGGAEITEATLSNARELKELVDK